MQAVRERLLALVDLPAVVLVALLLVSAWVLWRAQKSGRYDLGNMLRDADGKESAQRLAVLGAFAVSSWYLMRAGLASAELNSELYWAYLVTWSGSHVLIKAIEKWDGRFPWGRG